MEAEKDEMDWLLLLAAAFDDEDDGRQCFLFKAVDVVVAAMGCPQRRRTCTSNGERTIMEWRVKWNREKKYTRETSMMRIERT